MHHTVYLFDGFHLDVTRRKLTSSGGLVRPVNTRAMEVLLVLVANAGQLVEKRHLMEKVWPSAIVEDNNLNQCILAIRKALGETAGSNRYIMTVPGRGYCFVCPVNEVVQESQNESGSEEFLPGRAASEVWISLMVAASIAALVLMFSRFVQPVAAPAKGEAAVERPVLVLNLGEAMPTGDGTAATIPASVLADCLARLPHMKLHVVVQLVPDAAREPVWSGQYVAEAQDLRASQDPAQGVSPVCSELTD